MPAGFSIVPLLAGKYMAAFMFSQNDAVRMGVTVLLFLNRCRRRERPDRATTLTVYFFCLLGAMAAVVLLDLEATVVEVEGSSAIQVSD